MIDLIAKSAAEGLLPVKTTSLSIEEQPFNAIHSIAPLNGAKLKGFPDTGRSVDYNGGRLIWSARGQYFLIGATPPKMKAAITDQSDAWCHIAIKGDTAADLLARVCPLDTAKMSDGDAARSLIGHMTALILRTELGFEVLVFRAFAKTLVHELSEAMTSLEAQSKLPD